MCEKILLISEKQEDLGLFNKIFGNNKFVLTQSPSAKRIQKELLEEDFAVILADYNKFRDSAYLLDHFQKSQSRSCFIFYGENINVEDISEILQKRR